MSVVIDVENLTKQYGSLRAVDDLSFQVSAGQVFAFLGQNGAGKSTTIRMLLSLIRPDSGRIRLFGKDLQSQRISILRQTGAVIEKPDLYGYLTGFENLSLFAKLNGLKLSSHMLRTQLGRVGLESRANDKVKAYSQGMKQRLGIAVALVHDPQLIILDEPTNGLDPQGIVDIRNLILQLCHVHGKTVFISSHMLSEVQQVADHVMIIEKGRKIMQGNADELVSPEYVHVEIDSDDNHRCLEWIRKSGWDTDAASTTNGLIRARISKKDLSGFSVALINNGFPLKQFAQMNSLEDYFLSITQ
ncbi:ABC transporter ATP-binding protein [Pollutibacter soli]|uniref:ABC transporter ATP-binding protein n=1 Tax=Pollutibacter soli TaxID=3034157 RepID=UPI003013A191